LVNEALVNEYLGGTLPVGRQLGQRRSAPADTEIIGVFGNARYYDVRGEIPRHTFVNLDSRIGSVGRSRFYGTRNLSVRRAVLTPAATSTVKRYSPDASFRRGTSNRSSKDRDVPNDATSSVRTLSLTC